MNYWVICKCMNDECGHKWIAIPCTDETLQVTVELAKCEDGPVWVCEEGEKK